MSRRRFENLNEERQKRLFESAAEEFAEKGYEAASLNRILEKSGMGKSSLYYYFDDKADLFTTLVERSIAVLFKKIGGIEPEALAADTFWREFEDKYRKAISVVSGNSWLVRFGGMFYGLRANQKEGSPTGRIFVAARRWIRTYVVRGQELGVIRTDLPQSLLIDSTLGLLESLDRWFVMNWDALDEEERKQMPAKHIALFRDLLSPKAP